MNNKSLPYWLVVEESKTVRFSELAHLMAKAMHPGDHELTSYAAARINLDKELPRAVHDGQLKVRNRAGLSPHTFPHGASLQSAVMLPQDLRPFLAERGIELRLTPHGNGPDYWTLENAAAAIAEQEQWHDGARGSLENALLEAASSRALVVRNPHTDLPKTDGDVRAFYELVTPSDVNAWLEKQDAPYRWSVARPEVKPEPQAGTSAPVADSASNDATPDPERRLTRLRQLGGNVTFKRGEWKCAGITALVATEKSEGRKRSDEQTIRGDLKEAAQNELEARRAGFGAGLGQR